MGVENLGTNRPDGVTIPVATSEKFSLYGVTPIVQRSGSAQAAVATTVAVSTTTGAITSWGFSLSTQANGVVTLLNELRAAMVAIGAIKGSA